ncbi:MAG: cobalt-precorrin 5A hydrolase [Methanomicrobiales archaeon]|nr:cobalt-precorrin 5A hydrolase [Methanomicrobiales archaeon]
MKGTAVVFLPLFREAALRISTHLRAEPFEYSGDLFRDLFTRYGSIVCVMSLGIAVRKIAPLLEDKWTDPAVVVVSPDLKFAIPVVGGHHGANALAKELQQMGILPVISTATEALGKDSVEGLATRSGMEVVNRYSTKVVNAAMLIEGVPVFNVRGPSVVIGDRSVSFLCRSGIYTVGLGCRRGVGAEEVVNAVNTAFADTGLRREEVIAYATTERKVSEIGLRRGIEEMGGVLLYLDDLAIMAELTTSPSAAPRIGLKGVAEPCALAISKMKELVLTKRRYGRVTVAIAR